MQTFKRLIIIPARGGSKRIIDKNIKLLASKPLICHSIEFALSTSDKSNIFVSSDSEEILSIAKKYNVNTHLRKKEFAEDNTKMIDTTLNFLDIFNIPCETNLVLLQPTSPFRNKQFLNKLKYLYETSTQASSALSLLRCDFFHPAKIGELQDNKKFNLLSIESEDNVDNLKKKPYYVISGTYYVTSIKSLRDNLSFIGPNPIGLEEEMRTHCNIDNAVDLEIAKFIIKNNKVLDYSY